MTALPARSEVATEHKWNDTAVYASRDAWNHAADELAEMIPQMQPYQNTLSDSPTQLLAALALREQLVREIYKLFLYADMEYYADTTDQEAGVLLSRTTGLWSKISAAIAFIEPELLAIGRETLDKWIAENEALTVYAHYVDDLFRLAPHTRSAEVEQILGLVSDPFTQVMTTATMLSDADMHLQPGKNTKGEAFEVSQSLTVQYMNDSDREVRRTAWESTADGYLAHKNSFASNFSAAVKQNVFLANVRGYNTVLESYLSSDNLPPAVFHNVVDTFQKNLPVWHRYWKLKREVLGLEDFHTYDVWAPFTTNEPHIPFEQAVDWICTSLAPLGTEYVDTVRRACLEERWIDLMPNLGKPDIAFSTSSYDTAPYILMAYDGTFKNVSILAHELGHSMHSYLSNKHQAFINADYTTFAAEVASNVNQALLRHYLFEHQTDRDFQLTLLNEAMQNFVRYFFIMPTLARFQLEVHTRIENGTPLTADDMISLMADLYAEGYGGHTHIDHDRIGITWAQFPHLYDKYYIFTYSTGIAGANAFVNRILHENGTEEYLGFLRAGGSQYPLDAIQAAGVDLSKPEPIQTAFDVLASFIDRLEALMKETA